MKPALSLLLCVALSLSGSGCAPSGSANAPRRNPDVITADELAGDAGALALFDAIQQLRPAWLRTRGDMNVMAGGEQVGVQAARPALGLLPAVSLDNTMSADINVLRSVRAADVRAARFVAGKDATTRFGPDYVNGVIEVSTRTGTQ
jgi:hypothetical protein